MHWHTTRFTIDLARPRVMGIVNVTPDSFSDGGSYRAAKDALAHCEQLLQDGADILDIGGESTRPGAQSVPAAEELARVRPVVAGALRLGVPVSVDTSKPEVMQAVLDLGADIVNDVWALRQPGAAELLARHGRAGVCLMHMHREPRTMQTAPMTGDVIPQVLSFLQQRVNDLRGLGLDLLRIAVDPGIGFGKTAAQNFALLARQRELLAVGCPLLVGWSRKSSLAAAADDTSGPGGRLVPSVAAALLAVERGAKLVRVHDVRETVAALKVWNAANTIADDPHQQDQHQPQG